MLHMLMLTVVSKLHGRLVYLLHAHSSARMRACCLSSVCEYSSTIWCLTQLLDNCFSHAADAVPPSQFAGLGTTDIGRQRVRQQDAFAALHASLSLAAVPASLPCRQEERTRLDAFLSRALREGEHTC